MARVTRWYFFVPGNVYAYGPIGAASERAARRWIRDWLSVERLPNGLQVWRA